MNADETEQNLREALELTLDPQATYRSGTSTERRLLNQLFFERLLIGEKGEIVGAEMTPVYEAMRAWRPVGEPLARRSRRSETKNPGASSGGRGLTIIKLVEAGGIEPPTPPCKGGVFPLALRPRGKGQC